MALSGTIMAGLMAGGMPMSVAIVAGIALGCVLGGLNGMMIAYAKMPPFIVTLAMMTIARGLALIYTGGYPIAGIDQAFAFFGRGSVLGMNSDHYHRHRLCYRLYRIESYSVRPSRIRNRR